MSWAVVTKEAEIWTAIAEPGATVFDAAVFDPAPIFDTGTGAGRWNVVAKDVEVWNNSIVIALSGGEPVIFSVSPESGAPGTLLTITGQNFTGVTSVTIDGLEADFTIVSDTTITATVP